MTDAELLRTTMTAQHVDDAVVAAAGASPSEDHTTTTTMSTPHATWRRRPALRWLLTFAGFPLGSLLGRAVAGPVDTTTAALVGGAVNGLVIGGAQAWALRPTGVAWRRWIAATALGLAVGLAFGATVVDFGVSLGALVVQGAICASAVGAAQAVVLGPLLGRLAVVWPVYLAVLWAAGWAITTAAGVDLDEHFTIFGSSLAIAVTLATALLPATLGRRQVTS